MKILYDGWPLVYHPNSPMALHLLGILAASPLDVEPMLALPGESPAWLPVDATRHIHPTANTPRARLRWEQQVLPSLRRHLEADLLHATSSHSPLFGAEQGVVSPAGFEEKPRGRGFWEHLRAAAAQGGMSSLGGLFWPDDLPSPETGRPVFNLPSIAYPDPGDATLADSASLDKLDLPDGYVVYNGPSGEADLRRLLSAWSWAAAPVGDVYPLVAIGLEGAGSQRLLTLAAEAGLGESVRSLPVLSPGALHQVYQHSTTVFHPAVEPPWGGPARLALAYSKPLVSIESPRNHALVGPAAYLVDGKDSRLLGAALITMLVEEELAAELGEAGRQRAAGWSLSAFGGALSSAYHRIIDRA